MKTIRTMQAGTVIATISRIRGRYRYRVEASDSIMPDVTASQCVETWDQAKRASVECVESVRERAERYRAARVANGIIAL